MYGRLVNAETIEIADPFLMESFLGRFRAKQEAKKDFKAEAGDGWRKEWRQEKAGAKQEAVADYKAEKQEARTEKREERKDAQQERKLERQAQRQDARADRQAQRQEAGGGLGALAGAAVDMLSEDKEPPAETPKATPWGAIVAAVLGIAALAGLIWYFNRKN